MNINKCNPVRGSSYIDILTPIRNKQACINVRIFYDKCFQWAILSALHLVQRHPKIEKKRFIVASIDIIGDKRDNYSNLRLIKNYYVDDEKPDVPVENDDDEQSASTKFGPKIYRVLYAGSYRNSITSTIFAIVASTIFIVN